ncbi:hypothetical protein JB92DRAFT_2918290 [Gautieria morchelliformis]|nr:hypothetical protein JB92DRAFT_2918290 [Gautieria morchelliformis]
MGPACSLQLSAPLGLKCVLPWCWGREGSPVVKFIAKPCDLLGIYHIVRKKTPTMSCTQTYHLLPVTSHYRDSSLTMGTWVVVESGGWHTQAFMF